MPLKVILRNFFINKKNAELKTILVGQAIMQAARLASLQISFAIEIHPNFGSTLATDSLNSNGFGIPHTEVGRCDASAIASKATHILGILAGTFVRYAADG